MRSLFSIDVKCDVCDQVFDLLTEREKGQNWESLYDCEYCDTKNAARRIMSAPRTLKVSFPDGHKRGGAFAVLKEAAKLEVDAAGEINPKRRAEIERQVETLKRVAKREKKSGNAERLK